MFSKTGLHVLWPEIFRLPAIASASVSGRKAGPEAIAGSSYIQDVHIQRRNRCMKSELQSWLRPQPKGSRFTVHRSPFTVKKKKGAFRMIQNLYSLFLPFRTVNREPGTVNHIRQRLQLFKRDNFSCFL
jgi:hypothetical protein